MIIKDLFGKKSNTPTIIEVLINSIKLRILIFAILVLTFFNSCSFGFSEVKVIIIKGSDTMQMLTEALAEEFMERHPNYSIYIEGGGTAAGAEALANKQAHICTASRKLTNIEIKKIADNFNTLGIYYLIAKDALCIYKNLDNPIEDLSLDQLKDIFTCRINNWGQLGWDNKTINLYGRQPNSGTHLYLKSHVLMNDDYCSETKVMITTSRLIESIESDTFSIGYGGFGFTGKYKYIKINGVSPTLESIRNDTYPISRYLQFYTVSSPPGYVKEFIDWALSSEGQRIVGKSGLLPLFDERF